MSLNSMKVRNALTLKPTTVPTNPENGDMYYDTSLNQFQFYQNGVWAPIGGSGSGLGDDLASLNYNISFTEPMSDAPTSAISSIDITTGKTQSALYSAANKYYRLNYDASKTVTGSSVNMTLSAAPVFTVSVGDILVVGQEARRITTVTSQTVYVIESAFTVTPSPSTAACNVSNCVYTKDLNNFAADGVAPATVYTDSISSLLVAYNDTSASGVTSPNVTDPSGISFSASSDGTTYSLKGTREANPSLTAAITNLSTTGTNLYLRFFSSATSGSGLVNLVGYKTFFHRTTYVEGGGVQAQAYGFCNTVGTAQLNSTVTVVGGKTRITFSGFSYAAGVNAGTNRGQLEVKINGQELPRFINGTLTPDDYYTESSATSIDLNKDYSALPVTYDVYIVQSVIDTSTQNTNNITSLLTVPVTPQGRLSLSSTLPVAVSDITGATSISYLPYVGNIVPIYNSSYFAPQSLGSSGLTMVLNTSNQVSGSVYDLFAFLNSGILTIGAGPAWTSTTSRGTGTGTTQISQINGIWVNTVAITLKNSTTSYSVALNQATYLGSVYCTANGATSMLFKPVGAAGGTANVFGLYNAYNRIKTSTTSRDTTAGYTYASSTWRAMDGSNNNRVTWIDGLQQTPVTSSVQQECFGSSSGVVASIGTALDSTTAAPGVAGIMSGTQGIGMLARENFYPQLGVHFLQAMEVVLTNNTATWSNSNSNLQALVVDLEF